MKIYGINNVNYTNYGINKNSNKKNNQSFGSLIIEDLKVDEDYSHFMDILQNDKMFKQYVDMADKEGFDYVVDINSNDKAAVYLRSKDNKFKVRLFSLWGYHRYSGLVVRDFHNCPTNVKPSELANKAIYLYDQLKVFNTKELKEF